MLKKENKDILILDKEQTKGLDNTSLTGEVEYSVRNIFYQKENFV